MQSDSEIFLPPKLTGQVGKNSVEQSSGERGQLMTEYTVKAWLLNALS